MYTRQDANELQKFIAILLIVASTLSVILAFAFNKWMDDYTAKSNTPGTTEFNNRLADDEHYAYRMLKDNGKILSIEDAGYESKYAPHRYKVTIQDKNNTVHETLVRECDITIKTDITDISESYSDDMGNICLPYEIMKKFEKIEGSAYLDTIVLKG